MLGVFREMYAPQEPQMERHHHPLARPSGGVIGPTDWNEALGIITYGSPEQVVISIHSLLVLFVIITITITFN